jgi:hypothetical protein
VPAVLRLCGSAPVFLLDQHLDYYNLYDNYLIHSGLYLLDCLRIYDNYKTPNNVVDNARTILHGIPRDYVDHPAEFDDNDNNTTAPPHRRGNHHDVLEGLDVPGNLVHYAGRFHDHAKRDRFNPFLHYKHDGPQGHDYLLSNQPSNVFHYGAGRTHGGIRGGRNRYLRHF